MASSALFPAAPKYLTNQREAPNPVHDHSADWLWQKRENMMALCLFDDRDDKWTTTFGYSPRTGGGRG